METKQGSVSGANGSDAHIGRDNCVWLTQRESEVLSLLAEGRSGAQIAGELVLSPETVRTHVRNAMSKLGATTRSHAVALALQRGEIGAGTLAPPADGQSRSNRFSAEASVALQRMLSELVTLHDIDGGGVYLSEEDGLSLRRAAVTETPGFKLPISVALGDSMLGRAALERRAQLSQNGNGSSRATLIAVPTIAGGRLLGLIALGVRASRPIARSDLLLLQAFSNRVGELIATGGDVIRPLVRATEQFRASWSGASRVR
jgi:DNA-binding CsgD family transcriptional regulator